MVAAVGDGSLTEFSRRRTFSRVSAHRRKTRSTDSAARAEAEESALSSVSPISVDYDEARTSEERGTYHQPRLMAQGEFFLDVHPLRRLKSVLGRAKRGG